MTNDKEKCQSTALETTELKHPGTLEETKKIETSKFEDTDDKEQRKICVETETRLNNTDESHSVKYTPIKSRMTQHQIWKEHSTHRASSIMEESYYEELDTTLNGIDYKNVTDQVFDPYEIFTPEIKIKDADFKSTTPSIPIHQTLILPTKLNYKNHSVNDERPSREDQNYNMRGITAKQFLTQYSITATPYYPMPNTQDPDAVSLTSFTENQYSTINSITSPSCIPSTKHPSFNSPKPSDNSTYLSKWKSTKLSELTSTNTDVKAQSITSTDMHRKNKDNCNLEDDVRRWKTMEINSKKTEKLRRAQTSTKQEIVKIVTTNEDRGTDPNVSGRGSTISPPPSQPPPLQSSPSSTSTPKPIKTMKVKAGWKESEKDMSVINLATPTVSTLVSMIKSNPKEFRTSRKSKKQKTENKNRHKLIPSQTKSPEDTNTTDKNETATALNMKVRAKDCPVETSEKERKSTQNTTIKSASPNKSNTKHLTSFNHMPLDDGTAVRDGLLPDPKVLEEMKANEENFKIYTNNEASTDTGVINTPQLISSLEPIAFDND